MNKEICCFTNWGKTAEMNGKIYLGLFWALYSIYQKVE